MSPSSNLMEAIDTTTSLAFSIVINLLIEFTSDERGIRSGEDRDGDEGAPGCGFGYLQQLSPSAAAVLKEIALQPFGCVTIVTKSVVRA